MKELRDLLIDRGYQNVNTYIQSGNIIVESDQSSKAIEKEISHLISENFGYEIPSFVYSPNQWKEIIDNCPYTEGEKKVYFTFLDRIPEIKDISVNKADGDEFTIHQNVVFLSCLSYGKTKLSNNLFENKLKVNATSRNFKTVTKLLELIQ